MDNITYEDFSKLDLITAKILEATEIEGADKLYKLTVDDGKKERTICAGMKPFYEKEELIGKTIIIVANLEPRKLKGITSEGMLLAADGEKPVLLTTEKETKPGSKIK